MRYTVVYTLEEVKRSLLASQSEEHDPDNATLRFERGTGPYDEDKFILEFTTGEDEDGD